MFDYDSTFDYNRGHGVVHPETCMHCLQAVYTHVLCCSLAAANAACRIQQCVNTACISKLVAIAYARIQCDSVDLDFSTLDDSTSCWIIIENRCNRLSRSVHPDLRSIFTASRNCTINKLMDSKIS